MKCCIAGCKRIAHKRIFLDEIIFYYCEKHYKIIWNMFLKRKYLHYGKNKV